MEKILHFLLLTVKAIMVLLAIVIEFPIKLIASVSFIILLVIAAIFAPIFRNVTCPHWWEVYGKYAVKWKHNWHIVTWVFKNYDF